MRYKVILSGILLAGIGLGSVAMTLGRARGAAWIGQPLQLTVPVQLDAGQSASSLCAEADVFHADTKVEAHKVTVSAEPTAQADSVNLRIASTAMVDEPVVTIYLRAGCAQKTTRRYVLLADFPSETAAPVVAAPAESAPAKAQSAPVESPSPASTSPSTSAKAGTEPAAAPTSTAKSVDAPKRIAKSAAPPKAPAPLAAASLTTKAVAPAAAKAPEASRSRLKLDPLENLAERVKTLESTASTITPEDLNRDSQRIQQLQKDIKVLLDQAAKNESSMLAMRQRLEKAESERVSMGVVWALAGLVLACLAAVAILWNRNRKTEPSGWHQSVQDAMPSAAATHQPFVIEPARPEPAPVSPPTAPVAAKSTPTAAPPAPSIKSPSPLMDETPPLDVDVNLTEMDTDFSRLIASSAPHTPTVVGSFQSTRPAEAMMVHQDFYADDIVDVRQQAEFFEKLGKVDKAIDTLEQRIRTSNKDAPLLYIDVLHIAHAHDLKTDFRQFRDEFEQLFNVRVPDFALFNDSGRSLESHATLLQNLCKNWPSHATLSLIEDRLIRDPWDKNAEPFDMGAFGELLVLHGLLTRLLNYSTAPAASPKSNGSEHIDLEM